MKKLNKKQMEETIEKLEDTYGKKPWAGVIKTEGHFVMGGLNLEKEDMEMTETIPVEITLKMDEHGMTLLAYFNANDENPEEKNFVGIDLGLEIPLAVMDCYNAHKEVFDEFETEKTDDCFNIRNNRSKVDKSKLS